MIDLMTVLEIHNHLINEFGGSKGIRNLDGLQSALARPYTTFDSIDLYPQAADKAAAIFESLIINHPFIDGNKRIAYFLLRLHLLESGSDIQASELEKYEMTIAASKGELDIDQIKNWIKSRIILIK